MRSIIKKQCLCGSRSRAGAFLHVRVQMTQLQEIAPELRETRSAKRAVCWTTHHVGRFEELAVGLIGLETPSDRRGGLHHFSWREGAAEDASSPVFHNQLGIGVNFNGWRWLRHCRIKWDDYEQCQKEPWARTFQWVTHNAFESACEETMLFTQSVKIYTTLAKVSITTNSFISCHTIDL